MTQFLYVSALLYHVCVCVCANEYMPNVLFEVQHCVTRGLNLKLYEADLT